MIFSSQDTQKYTENFNLSGFEHKHHYGFYRAKVVCNHENPKDTNTPPEQEGRIIVWIPALMKDIPEDKGIFAYPVFLFAGQGDDPSEEKAQGPGPAAMGGGAGAGAAQKSSCEIS